MLNTILYAADVLYGINTLLLCSVLFYVVICIFCIIDLFMEYDSYRPDINRPSFWILSKWWIVALLATVCILIPSKKTVYLMLGSSYLQDSQLPEKVKKALELRLDEYINEKKDK